MIRVLAAGALGCVLGFAASCRFDSSLEAWCQRAGTCSCAQGNCCILENAACDGNAPCCEGLECEAGRCVRLPPDAGSPSDAGQRCAPCSTKDNCPQGACCRHDGTCASQECFLGICDQGRGKVALGGECGDSTDCVSGLCERFDAGPGDIGKCSAILCMPFHDDGGTFCCAASGTFRCTIASFQASCAVPGTQIDIDNFTDPCCYLRRADGGAVRCGDPEVNQVCTCDGSGSCNTISDDFVCPL